MPTTHRFLEFFHFFLIILASLYICVFFSTHFLPLISILAPKIWKKEIINYFKNSDFCKLLRPCAISALHKYSRVLILSLLPAKYKDSRILSVTYIKTIF